MPPDVLDGTFSGDGKMVWLNGVHRRRTTKPDSKALGGLRLQDAMNPESDRSFVMSAAKVDYQPADDDAVLRDILTVKPSESRISWKRASMGLFIAAAVEALDLLEKAIAEPAMEPLFGCLAVEMRDLADVRGAFDIRVADPDSVRGEPGVDEHEAEYAELLLETVIEVRGDPTSPAAVVDVGHGGAVAGTLTITPVPTRSGFELRLGVVKVFNDTVLREVQDAINRSDLLTVYYESGHTFTRGRIVRQRLTAEPFRNVLFQDFTDYEVNQEKPRLLPGKTLHDAIALPGDRSLFAWVVHHYRTGWLLCDDGAGEIADFLHLDDDGTLTVIHVKAAATTSPNRQIAVTRFEQVVSQAEKNARYLQNDNLLNHLDPDHVSASAAWHNGNRVPAADVVAQLGARVASDRTTVHIVQPHLLRAVHDSARAASDAGRPTRDSRSLVLLDTLLNSTRQTITAHVQDLWVVGSA